MSARTQAEVVFSGSGGLDKLLEKLSGGIKTFSTNTTLTSKNLGLLNKEAKITDGIFTNLKNNVTGLGDGLLGLGRKGKDGVGLIKDLGSSTITLSDQVYSANKGLTGLGLRFLGLKDEVSKLDAVLVGPASHFADIAFASNNTERSFIILNKVAKPLRAGLALMSDQAVRLGQSFLNLEKFTVSFVQKGVTLTNKSISFLSSTLSVLSKDVSKFGLIGKIASQQLGGISTTLEVASSKAAKFAASLNPNELEKVDKVGNRLAKTFLKIGGGLEKAATGVFLADSLGTAFRAITGFGQSVSDTKEDLAGLGEEAKFAGEKFLSVWGVVNTKLNTIAIGVRKVGQIIGDAAFKGLGDFIDKVNLAVIALSSLTLVAVGLGDAVIKATGLSDSLAAIQTLGIDTSAAEIAMQFGLVGEKLLFSAEAAREFARVSIASFAQTEDAAGFVTTLSSGAALQFGEMASGIQSVSAFTRDLSNDLNNAASSVEVSGALYNTLSAGIGVTADNTVDLTQANNFLNASLKLSSGTGADAAGTLDLLAKVTTVYGLSANEAAVTAGKLNQVVERGQVTFSQLTNNLGRTASVAQATGVSLDEMLSSVSALTKIQGAEAQQGLASLLSAITGQGEQSKKTVQELGVQFDLNAVKTKGLNVALRDLNEAAGGNAETLKRVIPDILAFQTAQALIGPVAADVDANLQAMSSTAIQSGEALNSVFEAGQQSTIKQFSNLMTGFNEVLVDFGQRTLPAIAPGVKFLENLLSFLRDMPEPIKNIIGLIVITKTVSSALIAGFVSLAITIGSVIATYIALNLVSKTLNGQLGIELRVIRQLVEEEKDWGGALARLVGLNKDVAISGKAVTDSVKKTKQAVESLSNVDIDAGDGSIDSLKKSLEEVRKKIKDFKKDPINLVDPVEAEKQISTLRKVRKEVSTAIKSVALSQKITLDELPKSIDKILKDSTKTVKTRVGDFQKVIVSIVSPERIGERGAEFQAAVNNIFEKSLNDASTTTSQKLLDISNSFKTLKKNATPELKKYLDAVESQLLYGTARIADSTSNVESAISNSMKDLRRVLPKEISIAYDKAVEQQKSSLASMETSIKSRKSSLKKVYASTLDALPEEAKRAKPRLKKAIDEFLNDNTRTLEDRTKRLNASFAGAFKDAPAELKRQGVAIASSVAEIARSLEIDVQESGLISDLITKQSVLVKKGAGNLQNAGNSVLAGVKFIKDALVVKADDLLEGVDYGEVFTKIRQDLVGAAKELPSKLRGEFLGASAGILIAFDTLVDSDKISADVKAKIGSIKDSLSQSLKDFATGKISFEKLEETFENARFQMNNALSGVANPELISKINGQLDKVNLKSMEDKFNKSVSRLRDLVDSIVDPELKAKIEGKLNSITFNNLEEEALETSNIVNQYLEEVAGEDTEAEITTNLEKIKRKIEGFKREVGIISAPIQTSSNEGNAEQAAQKAAKVNKELQTTEKQAVKTGKAGQKSFRGMTDILDGLAGTLGQTNPILGSMLSGMSSFLFSAEELTSGGKEMFEGLTETMSKNGKSTKTLGLLNRDFAASSVTAASAVAEQSGSVKALGKATANGSKLSSIFGKSMIGLRGAAASTIPVMGLTAGAISTAAAATWSFVAAAALAAAPFIAIGAAIAAVVLVLAEYVPWLGKIIDGDQKFAAASEKVNEELAVSLELFTEYQKNAKNFRDSNNENSKSLSKLKEELEVLEMDPKKLIPEKEFIGGWQRAFIYPLEAIGMTTIGALSNVAKFGIGTLKVIGRVGQFLTQNIPFVGAFFKRFADGAKEMADNTELGSSRVEGKVRNFFNKVRKSIQDNRAKGTRDAVAVSSKQAEALIKETDKLTEISAKQFGVASERSREIMALAAEGNRALTANEMKEVLKEENDLAKFGLEVINERVSAKEKELETIKDPKARAILEEELKILKEQTSEIEKKEALRIEFLNNQQSITTSLENTDAAKNTEATINRVKAMYTELGNAPNGKEAQRLFAELNDLEVSTNEAGESIINIADKTLSTASLASRKASIALKSAQNTFTLNVANSTNDAFNITQDDLATNIMNVIEGVNNQLAEDPTFAAEGARIIESLFKTNIKTLSGTGAAFGALTAAQQAEALDAQSGVLKQQLAQDLKANEENIKRINILREKGDITKLQSIKDLAREQTEIDKAQLSDLDRQVAAAKNNGVESQIYKDAIIERDDFVNQVALNRSKENRDLLEEELKIFQEQKDNELKSIQNLADKELNIFKLREKAINNETKSLQSQRDLNQAISSYEETLLQNKLKLTTDVQDKAAIEVELSEQRMEILNGEIEFEKQNLVLQQSLNELAMEREQIELRIQSAEIANQKLINQQKIDNAEANNLTEEELEALELQNDALTLQQDLIGKTQSQLVEFSAKQSEMDDRSLEALELKQKAQKASAEVDLELAKRNEVIAALDKQVEKIKLQSQLVEVTNKERTVGLENATAIMEDQTKILEEQKDFLNSMTEIVQQNYQIAITAEKNEFRKRRLEEESARIKLEALKTQQKIELAIFKINEQQKDLALEVRQIELAAAREKAAADIAVAEAEAAKVNADPRATEEQRAAAELNIRAAEAQLTSVEAQRQLATQQRELNAQGAGLRDLQFRQKQDSDINQAEFAVAQTTRRRSDDRQLAGQALVRARSLEEEFQKVASGFLDRLEQPANAVSSLAPNINTQKLVTQALANPELLNQRLEGKVDLNLSINVDGNVDAIDKEDFKKIASKTVSDGLYQLFDEISIRQR